MIDEMSDEEIRDYARTLSHGIFMASPAFDGASEEEIKEFLKEGGLPVGGQATLHDGRTGDAF